MKSENTIITRDVNFEILRIVAMLMIILHHFSRHISYEITFDSVCFNSIIVDLFALGGNIGVALFVLISGYFDSKTSYSSKKFFRLISQVAFYNVLFFIITLATGLTEFRFKAIPRVLFSFLFTGYEYWFINVYLMLMLFMPFLNSALQKIKKNQFRFFLITLYLIWSVFPYTINKIIKTNDTYFSLLLWFILLYLTGAYLKKYPPVFVKKSSSAIILYCLVSLVLILCNIISSVSADKKLNECLLIFTDISKGSLMSSLVAITLMILFASFKTHNNKHLFYFSSATFGVYLCHNNPFFTKILWYDIFRITDFSDSPYLCIYGLGLTLLIFIVCVFFDNIRKRYIETPIFNSTFINTITQSIDNLINSEHEEDIICN